jgi:hypothetical protein
MQDENCDEQFEAFLLTLKALCHVWVRKLPSFLFFWGGVVRLSPLGTSATNWPIDGDCEAIGGMRIGRGNLSTRIKPKCHFVNLKSHMTWIGLEPEPPRWEADH